MEEEEEAVSMLSRKELRKQKFMEYLAGKGKLKQPNPKPYLRDDCQVKKQVTTSRKVVQGKENKAPADRLRNGGAKLQTLAAQPTKHAAARKTVGDPNKVSVLTGRQKASRPPAAGGPAQPSLHQNPVPTRRSTVSSSRCDPTAAGHLKKQPIPGMQSSGRSHSSAPVTKANGRFGSSSKAAGSSRPATVSVRMSLGPMVKTKTGLIPAVTQPRTSQSQHLTRTSAAAAAAHPGAKKMQSSCLPPASVSRRKPLPATSLNNHERARSGIKDPNRSESNSEPPSSRNPQQSSKIPPSSGLGSTAQGQAAGRPTDRFTRPRSEGAGLKNRQPCKAPTRTSAVPASRCDGKAKPGGKSNAREEAGGRTGRSPANCPPSQPGVKRASVPGTSHTVPRPGRTVSRTGQPKTPAVPVTAVPQTEGKKATAAQEERMRKLQEWREAKGISYKRPRMPVKPPVRSAAAAPQPFWSAMSEEDEARSLIGAVERSLEDCIKLLAQGFPPGQVREVLSRLPPVARKFAKYWICQARLLEREGRPDVLPMFEEAVGVVLEPVDELRAVVFEILKKKDEIQAPSENEEEEDRSPTRERTPEDIGNNPMATPKPVRALLCGEKGDSSVVKYKITATPGGPPRQTTTPARVNGQEVRFFTPVRRSVRIERSSLRYPASLQDHDVCVTSYGDLIREEEDGGGDGEEQSPAARDTPMYVYRQNDALEDKVFVQLVYDDAV